MKPSGTLGKSQSTLTLGRKDKFSKIQEKAKQQDLDEFELEQEELFKKQLEVMHNSLKELGNANQADEVDKAYRAIQNDYAQNKDSVLDMLLSNITNVNIEIPRVIKGDFDDNE